MAPIVTSPEGCKILQYVFLVYDHVDANNTQRTIACGQLATIAELGDADARWGHGASRD
jgi:hypothetical protein